MGESADDTGSEQEDPGKGLLLDSAKKWIGIGAAALSVLSAGYGGLQYEAEKKARSYQSVQLLTTSQTQLQAHDYPGAWKNLQDAEDEINKEGVIVRALGGLTSEQARVQAAELQLALTWLREAGDADEQGERTQVSDQVLPVLSNGVPQATGSDKADLLAHIGYAYYLKSVDGAKGLKELQFYREAVALDPNNPYANTFWAMPVIAENNASAEGVAQAKKLYDAALASNRSTGELRQWIRKHELASVRTRLNYATAKPFFWQVVGEMQKAGEPFEGRVLDDLYREYVEGTLSVEAFSASLDKALGYLPAGVHIGLLQTLIKTKDDKQQQGYLQCVLALALEKAGKPQEALSLWRTARSGPAVSGLGGDFLAKQMDQAIARLSPGSAPAAAASPVNKKPTPVVSPRHH